jgi:membrane protease YdiL (CAAX protease family)
LWLIGQHYSGFIDIRERLVEMFDLANFRLWHIVLLSLVAAVPEEIFFRGAVQPVLGVLLTAVIFGALHALTPVYFAYAVVAGLGLGLMAEWHDSLWLPIAAHFAVDVVSLTIMARWAAQHQAVQSPISIKELPNSEPFS